MTEQLTLEAARRIAALKAEAERLRAIEIEARKASRDAVNAYNAARIAAHPIQPGDILRHPVGTMGKVISVHVNWLDEIVIQAVRQKSDGTFGKRYIPEYDLFWKWAKLHLKAGE